MESFVGPLIMQHARKFIKDEDLVDLKLSVWGGDIQLGNLNLRADALEHLTKLPVIVESGSVGSLRVTVPWTAFNSTPVRVYVDEIDITARSMDAAEIAQYFDRRAADATRSSSTSTLEQESLGDRGDAVASSRRRGSRGNRYNDDDDDDEYYDEDDDGSNGTRSSRSGTTLRQEPGWLDHTLRRIVNNVEIHIGNVLLRYHHGGAMAIIHVKGAVVASADAQWLPQEFVEPGEFNLIRKVLQVDSLSIHLNACSIDGQPIPPLQDPVFDGVNARVRFQILLDRTIADLPRNRIDCLFDDFSAKLSDEQFSLVLDIVGSISPENPRDAHTASLTDIAAPHLAAEAAATKAQRDAATAAKKTAAGRVATTAAQAKSNKKTSSESSSWISWMVSALVEEETVEAFDDLLVKPRVPGTMVFSVFVNRLRIELCKQLADRTREALATADFGGVGLEIVLLPAGSPSVFVGLESVRLVKFEHDPMSPAISIAASTDASRTPPSYIPWSLFDTRLLYFEPMLPDGTLGAAPKTWPSDDVERIKWSAAFSALRLEFHSTEWVSIEMLRSLGSKKHKPTMRKRLSISTAAVSSCFDLDYMLSLVSFVMYDGSTTSSSSKARKTQATLAAALQHRWLHSPPLELDISVPAIQMSWPSNSTMPHACRWFSIESEQVHMSNLKSFPDSPNHISFLPFAYNAMCFEMHGARAWISNGFSQAKTESLTESFNVEMDVKLSLASNLHTREGTLIVAIRSPYIALACRYLDLVLFVDSAAAIGLPIRRPSSAREIGTSQAHDHTSGTDDELIDGWVKNIAFEMAQSSASALTPKWRRLQLAMHSSQLDMFPPAPSAPVPMLRLNAPEPSSRSPTHSLHASIMRVRHSPEDEGPFDWPHFDTSLVFKLQHCTVRYVPALVQSILAPFLGPDPTTVHDATATSTATTTGSFSSSSSSSKSATLPKRTDIARFGVELELDSVHVLCSENLHSPQQQQPSLSQALRLSIPHLLFNTTLPADRQSPMVAPDKQELFANVVWNGNGTRISCSIVPNLSELPAVADEPPSDSLLDDLSFRITLTALSSSRSLTRRTETLSIDSTILPLSLTLNPDVLPPIIRLLHSTTNLYKPHSIATTTTTATTTANTSTKPTPRAPVQPSLGIVCSLTVDSLQLLVAANSIHPAASFLLRLENARLLWASQAGASLVQRGSFSAGSLVVTSQCSCITDATCFLCAIARNRLLWFEAPHQQHESLGPNVELPSLTADPCISVEIELNNRHITLCNASILPFSLVLWWHSVINLHRLLHALTLWPSNPATTQTTIQHRSSSHSSSGSIPFISVNLSHAIVYLPSTIDSAFLQVDIEALKASYNSDSRAIDAQLGHLGVRRSFVTRPLERDVLFEFVGEPNDPSLLKSSVIVAHVTQPTLTERRMQISIDRSCCLHLSSSLCSSVLSVYHSFVEYSAIFRDSIASTHPPAGDVAATPMAAISTVDAIETLPSPTDHESITEPDRSFHLNASICGISVTVYREPPQSREDLHRHHRTHLHHRSMPLAKMHVRSISVAISRQWVSGSPPIQFHTLSIAQVLVGYHHAHHPEQREMELLRAHTGSDKRASVLMPTHFLHAQLASNPNTKLSSIVLELAAFHACLPLSLLDELVHFIAPLSAIRQGQQPSSASSSASTSSSSRLASSLTQQQLDWRNQFKLVVQPSWFSLIDDTDLSRASPFVQLSVPSLFVYHSTEQTKSTRATCTISELIVTSLLVHDTLTLYQLLDATITNQLDKQLLQSSILTSPIELSLEQYLIRSAAPELHFDRTKTYADIQILQVTVSIEQLHVLQRLLHGAALVVSRIPKSASKQPPPAVAAHSTIPIDQAPSPYSALSNGDLLVEGFVSRDRGIDRLVGGTYLTSPNATSTSDDSVDGDENDDDDDDLPLLSTALHFAPWLSWTYHEPRVVSQIQLLPCEITSSETAISWHLSRFDYEQNRFVAVWSASSELRDGVPVTSTTQPRSRPWTRLDFSDTWKLSASVSKGAAPLSAQHLLHILRAQSQYCLATVPSTEMHLNVPAMRITLRHQLGLCSHPFIPRDPGENVASTSPQPPPLWPLPAEDLFIVTLDNLSSYLFHFAQQRQQRILGSACIAAQFIEPRYRSAMTFVEPTNLSATMVIDANKASSNLAVQLYSTCRINLSHSLIRLATHSLQLLLSQAPSPTVPHSQVPSPQASPTRSSSFEGVTAAVVLHNTCNLTFQVCQEERPDIVQHLGAIRGQCGISWLLGTENGEGRIRLRVYGETEWSAPFLVSRGLLANSHDGEPTYNLIRVPQQSGSFYSIYFSVTELDHQQLQVTLRGSIVLSNQLDLPLEIRVRPVLLPESERWVLEPHSHSNISLAVTNQQTLQLSVRPAADWQWSAEWSVEYRVPPSESDLESVERSEQDRGSIAGQLLSRSPAQLLDLIPIDSPATRHCWLSRSTARSIESSTAVGFEMRLLFEPIALLYNHNVDRGVWCHAADVSVTSIDARELVRVANDTMLLGNSVLGFDESKGRSVRHISLPGSWKDGASIFVGIGVSESLYCHFQVTKPLLQALPAGRKVEFSKTLVVFDSSGAALPEVQVVLSTSATEPTIAIHVFWNVLVVNHTNEMLACRNVTTAAVRRLAARGECSPMQVDSMGALDLAVVQDEPPSSAAYNWSIDRFSISSVEKNATPSIVAIPLPGDRSDYYHQVRVVAKSFEIANSNLSWSLVHILPAFKFVNSLDFDVWLAIHSPEARLHVPAHGHVLSSGPFSIDDDRTEGTRLSITYQDDDDDDSKKTCEVVTSVSWAALALLDDKPTEPEQPAWLDRVPVTLSHRRITCDSLVCTTLQAASEPLALVNNCTTDCELSFRIGKQGRVTAALPGESTECYAPLSATSEHRVDEANRESETTRDVSASLGGTQELWLQLGHPDRDDWRGPIDLAHERGISLQCSQRSLLVWVTRVGAQALVHVYDSSTSVPAPDKQHARKFELRLEHLELALLDEQCPTSTALALVEPPWRELLVAHLDQLTVSLATSKNQHRTIRVVSLLLQSLQLDNHSVPCDFPVPIRAYPSTTPSAKPLLNLVLFMNQAAANGSMSITHGSLRLEPVVLCIEDSLIRVVQGLLETIAINLAPLSRRRSGGAVGALGSTGTRGTRAVRVESLLIDPIEIDLSIKTAIYMFLSLERTPIHVPQIALTPRLPMESRAAVATVVDAIVRHALPRIPQILGSLALVGNPTNLIRNFTAGIVDLVSLPIAGARLGPFGLLAGIGRGASSFVQHVSVGTLSSVSGITQSVAKNLDRLTSSSSLSATTPSAGSSTGAASASSATLAAGTGGNQSRSGASLSQLGMGVVHGFTGVISQPILGAYHGGLRGLVTGLGMGLLGAVTKPVGSAMGLISLTTEGLLRTVDTDAWRYTVRRQAGDRSLQQLSLQQLRHVLVNSTHLEWASLWSHQLDTAHCVVLACVARLEQTLPTSKSAADLAAQQRSAYWWLASDEELANATSRLPQQKPQQLRCTLIVTRTSIALVLNDSAMLLLEAQLQPPIVEVRNRNDLAQSRRKTMLQLELRLGTASLVVLSLQRAADRAAITSVSRYLQKQQ